MSDVEDVKFVIIFDYPSSLEDYIHRIGRTGRSEQRGTAYAFFTPHNIKHANALINVLEEAEQIVNPKLMEMARSGHQGSNNFFNSLNFRTKFIALIFTFFFSLWKTEIQQ